MKRVLMLIGLAGTAAFCVGQGCLPSAPSPGGGSGPPGPASTADDGPDDPASDLPRVHNLTGPWEDNGREIRITQSGDQVTALYLQTYVCDHRDGTGDTSTTDLDFNATLSGDQLSGDITTCRYGKDNPLGVGIAPATMKLTVNEDDTTLTGTWHNDQDDTDVPITITRLGCLIKSASDYGLPPPSTQTSDYDALRVYRKDGSVQTVPDDYQFNPQTDSQLRRHRGVDYSSRNADGKVASLPFRAAVTGTADVIEGSAWNTIDVNLENGNVVQYLHASEIDVKDGDPVTPFTVLGKTGDTGASAIHLHVQAKDANGNYINPSCAQEGIAQH